ncbi:MAG: hypothetical protein ACFFAY_08585 [Promethearchaeota archaeon]
MTNVQRVSHWLTCLFAALGLSLINPVVIRVIIDMNKKANGRATAPLVRAASVNRIMADRPPNMRKLRIINEFNTCRIRSTFNAVCSYSLVLDHCVRL